MSDVGFLLLLLYTLDLQATSAMPKVFFFFFFFGGGGGGDIYYLAIWWLFCVRNKYKNTTVLFALWHGYDSVKFKNINFVQTQVREIKP